MAQSFDPLNQPSSPSNKNNHKNNNKSNSILAIVLLLILVSAGILLFLIFKDPNNPITTSIKTTNSSNITSLSTNTPISSDSSLMSSQKVLINASSIINSSFGSASNVASSGLNKLGSISGYLIYPSDFIPGQNVCAKEQKTNQEFCVSTTDGQETYKINNLPQGNYKVYVQSLNTNNVALNKKPLENLVYYNQYVVDCMMKDYDTSSCLGEAVPSSYHTNIYSIEIKDGNSLENINPWDWYSTASASKQVPNPVILPNG